MPNEIASLKLSEDEQCVLRAVGNIVSEDREPTLNTVFTKIWGAFHVDISVAMQMPGEEVITNRQKRAYCREHLIALNTKGCIEAPISADIFPEETPFTLTTLGREWLAVNRD